MSSDRQWWLRFSDGTDRRLDAGGMLIGRLPSCDVVVADLDCSRRQALIYLDAEGPRLVPMGRGATTRNGKPVDGPVALESGDTLTVPGLELRLDSEGVEGDDDEALWLLQRSGGALFGVPRSPFVIGGGDDDDVRIEGLPPGAMRFHITQKQLSVESDHEIQIGDEPVPPGELVPLRPRRTVSLGDVSIKVIAGATDVTQTTRGRGAPEAPPAPNEVRLEFLPRGGRLHLAMGRDKYSTYLSDRRCDLVATLLQPPKGYNPGEFVPDDLVCAKVWPGKSMGRTDLNVLVHRLRKDLMRAGVDALSLVQRARGGGGTPFTVAEGAKVAIE